MKKSNLVLMASVLLLCICVMTFASCTTAPSVVGTYYLYEDNATDGDSWVKLSENKRWSDSDGMSGRYTLEDTSIVFYVSFDGQEEELLSGTLKDGKLTVGSLGVNIVYYLDGYAPDSSEDQEEDNSNLGNNENNNDNNGENNNENSPEALLADFTYEKDGDKYIITGVKDASVKTLVVPDFVSEIKDSAFVDCKALEHITVPFVGTSKDYKAGEIAEFAVIFKGETALAAEQEDSGSSGGAGTTHRPPTLVGGDKYKPTYSFVSELKSIVVTGDVLSSAYLNNSSLETVEFKGSVYGLPYTAFQSCHMLKKVILGTSIQQIGAGAFEYCDALEEIVIPDGLASVENGTFDGCSSLEKIDLPDSVTSIGDSAFGCTKISNLTLPKNLSSFSSAAFGLSQPIHLTSITVREGNTTYKAVNNCLIEISSKTLIMACNTSVIPDDGSVTSISYNAFNNLTGLTEIVIPSSITEIGAASIQGCPSLKKVIINDGVIAIGNSAFSCCYSLAEIVIPNTVTLIDGYAFSQCEALTSIEFNGTMDEWNSISKGEEWDRYTGAYTVHCTDGDIAKS